MKHARSGIASENLQEVLDASVNGIEGGQQQYVTPEWLADQCAARLPNRTPATILDPQCGEGSLVNIGTWSTDRYGIDIDNRLKAIRCKLITGNCVKVAEAMDDAFPGLHFECGNANPPFGRKFKLSNGSVMDSTEWTWKFITSHANFGYFISNHSTLVKLGIAPNPEISGAHPWVYHYEVREGLSIWKGVRDTLKIGIAFWKNPKPKTFSGSDAVSEAWEKTQDIVDEEKVARPPFNIYLDGKGYLKTYLSHRSQTKLKLTKEQVTRLHEVNGCHPVTLTADKDTRDLMRDLIKCGIYTLQSEAKRSIEGALADVNAAACPIMPPSEYSVVAYADENESLECAATTTAKDYQFTSGRRYPLSTGTYRFVDEFTRKKPHFDERTLLTYTKEHKCQLSGEGRYIRVRDDNGKMIRFMEKPRVVGTDFEEETLWKIFKQPVVPTISDTSREAVDKNLAVLKCCEMLAGFDYYPGQLDYASRVGVKNYGLIAAAVGTGKTCLAVSLVAMKTPERTLIIAPQGTVRPSQGDDDEEDGSLSAAQWFQEIQKFAPELQAWELFSYGDYERICSANGGRLPPGVYVSYYEALFINGARENAPESWDDKKLNKYLNTNFGLPPLPEPETEEGEKAVSHRHWCDQVGVEKNGIRAIIKPCLATQIGHLFDCVVLDEAHKCKGLSAVTTQMLIRMQPKYRYALTATPITNTITDLFPLMGWLAIPDWYKGERRSPAWPYAREELGRFEGAFLTQERDLTAEDDKRRADPLWRGVCIKPSPVISAPARLLKILTPTMAFIAKESVSSTYITPDFIDVRVPMGKEQSVLYGYYLDRSHIPCTHPLVRARKQTAWLRAICSDPAGFSHGGVATPVVSSNMNPKVIAILELARDILGQGEQVVIINSRVGLSNTIERRLAEAGVSIARIDSTISPDQHSYQANLFKRGKMSVMIMGLKCAAAYSFDQCKNLVIGSLEYSYGTLAQAAGRIDRVTNTCKKKIYCILHKDSIEEVQYDVVSVKGDAAQICLHGRRIPRDYKPVDPSEILAEALDRFDTTGAKPEHECEAQWPTLCANIKTALEGKRVLP